jgi:hypothetical protein
VLFQRANDEPISRLAADEIRATEFADPRAGGDPRRYHGIAVDMLRQEGHPSSPVGFDREWKEHQEPFKGERHP